MVSVARLKRHGFTLAPDQRVLKSADYRAYVDAERLIEDARAEADAILAEAKQEYENHRQRGYEDGVAQGKAEVAEQILETVTNTVRYFSSVESKVVQVVLAALRKILADFDDKELTLKVVKNALTVVRNEHEVTLRVAPEQVEPLKARLHEILSDYAGIAFINVSGDRRLSAGACILESEIGIVHASVDAQLQALERAMRTRLGDTHHGTD